MYTAHQAMDQLAAIDDLVLAIVDLNLPDAICEPGYAELPWFGLPARIRRERPDVPIIIFSAHASGALINAAQRLGAEFIFKEDFAENWLRVAERLELRELSQDWRASAYLQGLRESHALSRRQLQIAALALRGLGPGDIGLSLGISRNSVKRHSENLRRKTGHRSLRALARSAVGLIDEEDKGPE